MNDTQAPPDRKLPYIYLLDSILKNVRGPFIPEVERHLIPVMLTAYATVDPATRQRLHRVLGTWGPIFSERTVSLLGKGYKDIDRADAMAQASGSGGGSGNMHRNPNHPPPSRPRQPPPAAAPPGPRGPPPQHAGRMGMGMERGGPRDQRMPPQRAPYRGPDPPQHPSQHPPRPAREPLPGPGGPWQADAAELVKRTRHRLGQLEDRRRKERDPQVLYNIKEESLELDAGLEELRIIMHQGAIPTPRQEDLMGRIDHVLGIGDQYFNRPHPPPPPPQQQQQPHPHPGPGPPSSPSLASPVHKSKLFSGLKNLGILSSSPASDAGSRAPAEAGGSSGSSGSRGRMKVLPDRPSQGPGSGGSAARNSVATREAELEKMNTRQVYIQMLTIPTEFDPCEQCGRRVLKRLKPAHLDAHFRERQAQEKGGTGPKAAMSRKWFKGAEQWVHLQDAEVVEGTIGPSPSFFELEAQEKERSSAHQAVEQEEIPVLGANQALSSECGICGEEFDRHYDEADEEWVYENCINHGTRSVHHTCHYGGKRGAVSQGGGASKRARTG
eukprot:TRINITY_DN3073_c0_g1_i2.p1 TRINITY_DN3073_c0_g1~~TRINITY_DN3073_c0_g1_i2.p1  ORF type:complete len:554 (+),score=68.18 TRINITY_DN3073_c0_g1_i2:755-2416(+)